jgi:hypothetical protein
MLAGMDAKKTLGCHILHKFGKTKGATIADAFFLTIAVCHRRGGTPRRLAVALCSPLFI